VRCHNLYALAAEEGLDRSIGRRQMANQLHKDRLPHHCPPGCGALLSQ
jgi:hypothetical protein